MTASSLPPGMPHSGVHLTNQEFDRISSCSSALHSILTKTPNLDANERLDLVEMISTTLSRALSGVHERLSDQLHGQGGEDEKTH